MAKSRKNLPKDDHRFQLKHLSIDDDRHWGYIKNSRTKTLLAY